MNTQNGCEATPRLHRQVLADHTRKGKRFIPPFVERVPLTETPWISTILPELLSIAALTNRYGLHDGVQMSVALAKAAADSVGSQAKPAFAFVSDFQELTTDQWSTLRDTLEGHSLLTAVRDALSPVRLLYPRFPMRFLFDDSASSDDQAAHLAVLKELVNDLLFRQEQRAMLAQGTAVYVAAVVGVLEFAQNVGVPDFEAP